jgi:putative transposase
VLEALLAEDVARLVGSKGHHNPERTAVRHGSEPGRVTLGGRRVRVQRPRVRTADGTGELAVPSDQAFAATDLLGQLAVERMLAKLSTRRYPAGLEPVGTDVERAAAGTSRSAVWRRFVAPTEHALAELLAADLSGLDLVALLIDGIGWPSTPGWSPLASPWMAPRSPRPGRGRDRERHGPSRPAGGLWERGLEVTRPMLVVLDGATAWAAPSPRCSTTRSASAVSCIACPEGARDPRGRR